MRNRVTIRSMYRSGNSLVIAIPQRHRKALGLVNGSSVQLSLGGDGVLEVRNVTSALRGEKA